MTTITLSCGLIFLIGGLLFKMFPPKKINWIYGYRTSSSMRNIDTWRTANKYSANFMVIEGIILTIIGLITFLIPNIGKIGIAIAIGLIILSVIILAVSTEKHLNRLFDKEGKTKIEN